LQTRTEMVMKIYCLQILNMLCRYLEFMSFFFFHDLIRCGNIVNL